MARSLTVTHDETPSINWLFGGFLLLAIGWMTLAGIAGASAAPADLADAPLIAE